MTDINPNKLSALSQKKEILRCLQSGMVLTKANAKSLTGAEDYRKRISELRREGHNIRDRWVGGINRYGHHERYKEYYIPKEAIA